MIFFIVPLPFLFLKEKKMNIFIKLLFVATTGLSLNAKNINNLFTSEIDYLEIPERPLITSTRVLSNELQLLHFDENMHLSHSCYSAYTYYACVNKGLQKIVKAKSDHPINLCVEIKDKNNTRIYKNGISRGENEIEISVPTSIPINIYFKGDPLYTTSKIDIDVSFVSQSMITCGTFSNTVLQDLKRYSALPDRAFRDYEITTISDALEKKAFEQDVVLYYYNGSLENNELYLKNENMLFPNEIDFSKTKLAILGAAGTAGEGPSIAQYAVSQGAHVSIGFTSVLGPITFRLIQEFVKFFVMNYSNAYYRTKPIKVIVDAALRSMRQADQKLLSDFDVVKIYGDINASIVPNLPLSQSDDSFRIPNQDDVIFVPRKYAESIYNIDTVLTLPIDTTIPTNIQNNAGSVEANSNKNYRFNFVAPSSGYYTVEAYGRDKIYLCVDDVSRQIFDGGEEAKDNNAKITFLARKNNSYLFHVKRDGSLVSDEKDYIYLKVRKAEAYALFDYLDYDFHLDGGKQNKKDFISLSSIIDGYYDYHVHNRISKKDFLSKLNNEILYVDGHVNSEGNIEVNGSEVTLNELPAFNNNKLSIWNLCKTYYGIRIDDYLYYDGGYPYIAYENGSKCSIGIHNNTKEVSKNITQFTKVLFTKILSMKDKTVQECLDATQQELYFSDTFMRRHISVFGDPNIKVFSETESNNAFPIDNLIFQSNNFKN